MLRLFPTAHQPRLSNTMLLNVGLCRLFSFALCGLLCTCSTVAADECLPVRWLPGSRWSDMINRVGSPVAGMDLPSAVPSQAAIQPGDINCLMEYPTDHDFVNCRTCPKLADLFDIDLELFFKINPSIKRDCSNI